MLTLAADPYSGLIRLPAEFMDDPNRILRFWSPGWVDPHKRLASLAVDGSIRHPDRDDFGLVRWEADKKVAYTPTHTTTETEEIKPVYRWQVTFHFSPAADESVVKKFNDDIDAGLVRIREASTQ